MKRRYHKMLFIGILLLCSVVTGGVRYYQHEDKIHIALVGPLTGQSPVNGRHHLQGVNLYLDKINKKGGVNGKKIVLDIYDDQNDPHIAAEKARQVVNENKAVAVIGHNYSSCSINAGQVYKVHEIPAVTPSSTDVKVTLDNDWFFRVVYNNRSQAQQLADYVKSVLKEDSVVIIHEDLAYGSYLADVFEENLKERDIAVKNVWEIKTGNKSSDQEIENIVGKLSNQKHNNIIFLAVHAPEGIKLVKRIKDAGLKNTIIGPDSLASKSFSEGFSQYPKEKLSPGFYSNGIYVVSPLVFDSAGEKVRKFQEEYLKTYNEDADWRAAFAYETALIIVEALKETKIEAKPGTITEDRRRIRDYLAGLTKDQSVEGITGFNYFDQQGDSSKPFFMGVFKNRKIISALVQIQAIRFAEEIPDLQHALEKEQVLAINGGYMYKTNVVYTGIEFYKISEMDFKAMTCQLDFLLWFRYQGEGNVSDIKFLNSMNDIRLGNPVETVVNDRISYSTYRVNDRFKMDFLPGNYVFGRHMVGMGFRNRNIIRQNLVYVVDELGMGTINGQSTMERMRENRVLSEEQDYTISQIRYSQETIKNNSLGNPRFLNILSDTIEYSGLNAAVYIDQKTVSLRGIFPVNHINVLTIVCLAFLILLYLIKNRVEKFGANKIWLMEVVFVLMLLLSSEMALIYVVGQMVDSYYIQYFITLFDILWWIVPAFILNSAIKRLLLDTLEKKTEREIPTLVKRFIGFIIFLFAFFGIVAFVFDQKLTSILATSGLIAMIIGLAIQINISNIFSGIAINLETPFRLNDWVKIGSFDEGKVMDITWRSTHIRTRDGCILNIPNSLASESVILNFNYPNRNCSMCFNVHVDPIHRFERVQKILMDAVISAEGVLTLPQPTVSFSRFTDWSAEYAVAFYINEYGCRITYTRNVWKRIYIHLNRAGIVPLIKRQEIRMTTAPVVSEINNIRSLPAINNINLFQQFSEAGKSWLNGQIREKQFAAGEQITPWEGNNNSFFIIVEGVVEKEEKFPNQEPAICQKMGVEDFFECLDYQTDSNRTYKSVTDSVLLEIPKINLKLPPQDEPLFKQILNSLDEK